MLELDSFSYSYPGASRPALAGVSLSVAAGEFVVLAGGSGSGKSTLLRAACGLVPHFHGGSAHGAAAVAGHDLRDHGPADLSAYVGAVLQDPETQVLMNTVRAEIAFPLENRGRRPAEVARAVEEAALALGISGLLDEPTSQLDPVAGDELLALLVRINEDWGTTVMIAEHRLERCLSAADRVVAMSAGRVACDAPPAGFLAWARQRAPDLQTPAARLFSLTGREPLPVSVKAARRRLAAEGRDAPPAPLPASPPERAARLERSKSPALDLQRIWLELRDGPVALRDASLSVAPGERVALMGRNGAGKSTLLRVAAGLVKPTRGRVRAAGRVALLLQYPGDYFVHDRVGDELPPAALAAAGLSHLADRHPRDLSGGERQRLALAIVCDGGAPAVLCLDEPTRGMGQSDRRILSDDLRSRSRDGTAVVVATHDAEFAAEWAQRVVLLGDGRPVADAPTHEVLSGGWYFSTQTARILDGAALLPADGAAVLGAADARVVTA